MYLIARLYSGEHTLLYTHQTLWFSSGSDPPGSSSDFFPCYASALCVTYGCCKLGLVWGRGILLVLDGSSPVGTGMYWSGSC